MNNDIDPTRVIERVTATAREVLLPRFARVARRVKADGSIVTEADSVMQQRLAARLQETWPGIAVLGEEMPAAEQQALLDAGGPLWVLDPLDGTSNFAHGIPFFSVSLALIDSAGVRLGVVYDPLRDECFEAVRGDGARCNGVPLQCDSAPLELARCAAIIDFKRLPAPLACRLASEPPYASQRSYGSVALDWCWLAAGRGQLYLHGRQRLWDYAAGSLILAETGGRACTLTGEAIGVGDLQPRSVIAASNPPLFDPWRGWLLAG